MRHIFVYWGENIPPGAKRVPVECKWSEEDQDACWYCSGEACAMCGAGGCGQTPFCDHDHIERHTEVFIPDEE